MAANEDQQPSTAALAEEIRREEEGSSSDDESEDGDVESEDDDSDENNELEHGWCGGADDLAQKIEEYSFLRPVDLGENQQGAADEMTSDATIRECGWHAQKQGAALQGKEFQRTKLGKAIAVAVDRLPGIIGKCSSFARVNTERQQPAKLSKQKKKAKQKAKKKKKEKKSDGRHNDVRGLTVETARGIHHLAPQDGKVTFHCGEYTSVKTIPAGHMLVLDMRIMEKNDMGIEHSHGDGRADKPFQDKKQQVISVSTVTRIAIDPKELARLCSAKTTSVSTEQFVSFEGKFVAPSDCQGAQLGRGE